MAFIDDDLNAQGLIGPAGSSAALDQTIEYRSHDSQTSTAPVKRSDKLPANLGPYRPTAFLGEGGMGRVYSAVDASGQPVAIKVLNQSWSRNPDSMERFKQEGALAGTINHPRCVFVREVNEVNGQPFIVMELMSGQTLKDLVVRSGPLTTSEAVSKILDVIDGIQEAHERGVIHRDIKPANCFLEPSGRVKLGDFGLARSLQQESDLTQSGSFIGTPLFASPEQIRGESLDYRTDIYSVCATLYYLLTGQAPFGQYSSTQVIARIVSDDPAPIRKFNPELPKLLEQVLQKGLSRNRERRFQDLHELRNALVPFVRGRQAIAQLARRLAAYGFDTCLLTIAMFGLASVMGDSLYDPTTQSLSSLALYHGIAWAYFILLEGYFSASPGKLALQLHVADSRTGERASFKSLLLRATVYLLIGFELPSLAVLLSNHLSHEAQLIAQLAATIAGVVLLLVTMRPKYGSRLLHEVLSSTLVVADHDATQPVRLLPAAPLRELSTTAGTGWPVQMGAYEVRGVIWQTAQQALLLGRDERLNRDVWLVVDREKPIAHNPMERHPSRPARLRYLSHGEQQSLYWTALVAPAGAPLRYWVTPERPLSWREARLILEQIVEEFRHSRDDATPLNLTSLDQLWLDAQGRISLADWSLSAPADHSSNILDKDRSLDAQPLAPGLLRKSERDFATEVMRMSLTGKSRPWERVPAAVETPLPMHARNLLERLRNSDQTPTIAFEDVQHQLRDSATRPWVVGSTVRFCMIGISLLSSLAFVGAMISITRVGNQATLMRLEDSWIEASALQAVAEDKVLFEEWRSAMQKHSPDQNISATQLLAATTNYKQACRSAIEPRWKHGGIVLRQILAGGFFTQIVDHAESIKFERVPGQQFTLRLSAAPPRIGNLSLTSDVLSSRWQRIQAGDLGEQLRRAWFVMILVQIPFLVLIVWSAVSRGGLPFWLLGVNIVRRNGVRASRWLIGWRSLIAWTPMMMLNGAIVAIDIYWPEMAWLATTLHLSMLGLLLIYTAIALRWPDCGPQDWLAGTRLMPA